LRLENPGSDFSSGSGLFKSKKYGVRGKKIIYIFYEKQMLIFIFAIPKHEHYCIGELSIGSFQKHTWWV